MHKNDRPSIFSVLLQLKNLTSENVKIFNWSQNCWQRWERSISFFKNPENSDLLFL